MAIDRSQGHVEIDYKFGHPKHFSYENALNFQPLIRMQFFFSKRPDISWDHFSKHFGHVHADMTVSAKSFGVFGVQRYTQLHQFPEMKEKGKCMGYEMLDFDGCSTMWFKNFQDADAFFQSEEKVLLGEDCKEFMDLEKGVKVLVGMELTCFGQGVPDIDANDGVLPYGVLKNAESGEVLEEKPCSSTQQRPKEEVQ